MTIEIEDLVIPSLEEAVIGREDNPLRFERFCDELYGTDQNITVVTTGRTWDQGRDGRSLAGPMHILCVSLREDIDQKAHEDIDKLALTSKPDALVFCTSRPLSEHACDGIADQIRKRHPVSQIIVLGRQQLSDLARKNPVVLRTHYRNTIEEIRQTLLAPSYSSPDSAEADAFRLALCTHGRPDAAEFRAELLRTIILELLATKGALSANEIAKAIYEDLRLSRPMQPATVEATIRVLTEKHLAKEIDCKFTITDDGQNSLVPPDAAASKLIEGRTAVRFTIETNLGYALQNEEFLKVWTVICSSLGDIFFENGARIVRGIGLLLGDHPTERGHLVMHDVVSLIEQLGKRAGLCANTPDRQKELTEAIIDAFLEPGSTAFEWLSDVAATFVCIASLGLVGTSIEAIRKCIVRTILVPDTDVILSLWCEAEPAHSECQNVYTGWRIIGGQFAVAPVIMEEVAHHAFIAEADYDDTVSIHGRSNTQTAFRLINNAFVRTYWTKAHKFSKAEFLEFIKEYRGKTEHDYQRVQDIARRDYKFSVMQEVGDRTQLAIDIQSFLITIQKDPERRKSFFEDKTRRDGVLLASVKAWRNKLAAEGTDMSVAVLSSSTLLERASAKFRSEFGDDGVVMSLGSAAYLLTLLPNSKMSLASMRTILFEPKRRRFGQLQRMALRALAATEQYAFPFSRRSTLLEKLNDAIQSEARARGVTHDEQEEEFLSIKEPESNARIIAKAVDELAVSTRVERENVELRRQLEEMKERLARAREKA